MLLAIEDVGPGPVVVLIHGFPLDRTMWEGQFAGVGSTYRIIAPDLRGAGQTAVPDGVYPIDLLADDVIDTLDALELTEPVVVGGLSMGGYVALSLVLRYPDRFRGLMLMNTRAVADTASTAQVREDLARQLEATGKPDVVIESMLPKLFAPSTYAQNAEAVDRLKLRMAKASPQGMANTLRGMAARPDRTAQLGSIAIPTLVLAGSEDQLIPMEESSTMAEAIPDARLVVISGTGHLTPVENKADANAAILAFLREIGP